jgi:hypothetical protein
MLALHCKLPNAVRRSKPLIEMLALHCKLPNAVRRSKPLIEMLALHCKLPNAVRRSKPLIEMLALHCKLPNAVRQSKPLIKMPLIKMLYVVVQVQQSVVFNTAQYLHGKIDFKKTKNFDWHPQMTHKNNKRNFLH